MCGYYVCYSILERAKGLPMREILLDFSKPEANEQMIEMFAVSNTDPSGETNPYKFLLHPLLSAEPDLNPATNGA